MRVSLHPKQALSGMLVACLCLLTAAVPPALDALKTGKAYNGDASVFGTPYIADYEQITDSSSQTIGAYFAGCKK
jgi:hypothetical protein